MINRVYESQLQSRSRHFSLSDVENVRGQPRGDGARIAAVGVPALLGDALVRVALQSGHVGAVAPAGRMMLLRRRSANPLDPLGLVHPGGSILGGRTRLRPSLSARRRRLLDAPLSFVPRQSLGGCRLLSARNISRQRHPPRSVQLAGVRDLRVPALLHTAFRVFLQAVHVRAAATLAAW